MPFDPKSRDNGERIFDASKPVQTRGGHPARILCTDRKHRDGPIVALVRLPDDGFHAERDAVHFYYSNGCYEPERARGVPSTNVLDLVNVPVKTSDWLKIYTVGTGTSYIRPTKEPFNVGAAAAGWIRRDFEDGVFVRAEFEPIEGDLS